MTTEDQPKVTISLVIEETSTLAEYRASEPDVDPEQLAIVDELLEKGRVTLHPKWAAGAGEPDRGDDFPL